jgi:hypothetical protein
MFRQFERKGNLSTDSIFLSTMKCRGDMLTKFFPWMGVLAISTVLASAQAPIRILTPADQTEVEKCAEELLVHEAQARMPNPWVAGHQSANEDGLTVVMAKGDAVETLLKPDDRALWKKASRHMGNLSQSEGFAVASLRHGRVLVIAGSDVRGELFGAGWLLRHMRFQDPGSPLPEVQPFYSAPEKPVRGYQIGYRMKNNTYDAWTLAQFEQQMRDLAVFGMNTVQVVAPISDDERNSPLFPASPMEVVVGLSRLSMKYGLRYDLYYPEMAKDYGDPAQVAAELAQFEDLVKKLPQVDSLHVPGGDPGHTAPDLLFPLLEREAVILHRYHPRAEIWLSAQGFDAQRFQQFYAHLQPQPKWLTGIFFGPQTREGMPLERERIPSVYKLEFYPDIGHTMHAQFPVPEWDPVFALTEGREPICPRPEAFAAIYRHFARDNTGFMLYSEGVNDDVNKFLWARLGWQSTEPVPSILREYAQYLLHTRGDDTRRAALAIAGLERNWTTQLLDPKSSIPETHSLFASLHPQPANWRWNSLLYRDTYDQFLQWKRRRELDAEVQAMRALRSSGAAAERVAHSEAALNFSLRGPEESALRNELFRLADKLFHEIGLQLSVPRYGASNWERGANLDRVDTPLNDRTWISASLHLALEQPGEEQRLKDVLRVASWKTPVPGTLYDDLGDPSNEPHLVRGPAWLDDPEMYDRSIDGIADHTLENGWKMSWLSYAETLYETKLRLRYNDLRHDTGYRLRITYAGEDYVLPMELTANEGTILQPMRRRLSNPEQLEYDLPRPLTQDGTLTLSWKRPTGAGGGGRGGQVAEVWLIPTTSKSH